MYEWEKKFEWLFEWEKNFWMSVWMKWKKIPNKKHYTGQHSHSPKTHTQKKRKRVCMEVWWKWVCVNDYLCGWVECTPRMTSVLERMHEWMKKKKNGSVLDLQWCGAGFESVDVLPWMLDIQMVVCGWGWMMFLLSLCVVVWWLHGVVVLGLSVVVWWLYGVVVWGLSVVVWWLYGVVVWGLNFIGGLVKQQLADNCFWNNRVVLKRTDYW